MGLTKATGGEPDLIFFTYYSEKNVFIFEASSFVATNGIIIMNGRQITFSLEKVSNIQLALKTSSNWGKILRDISCARFVNLKF